MHYYNKHIIFTFLAILLSIKALCQYTLDWNRTYGDIAWDEANSVVQTYDHNLILAGFTKSEGGNRFLKILKINEFGEKILEKTFKDFYHSSAEKIIEAKNHDLLIAGWCVADGEFYSKMWVLRLDEFGNLLWQKTFTSPGDAVAVSIMETYDNGIVVAGNRDDFTDYSVDMWTVKLNQDGEQLWEQTFGSKGEDLAYGVCELYNHDIIFCGSSSSGSRLAVGSDRSFWLIKTSENGEWYWEETYGDSTWDVATSVIETDDHNMVVTGFTKNEGVVNYDLLVMKIDPTGKQLWKKKFENENWDESTCIIQTSDKNMVISAYTRSRKDRYSDFWVLKIDQNGQLLWDFKFERNSTDYAKSVVEFYDKGLVVAGTTFDKSKFGWQMAVLKFFNTKRPAIGYIKPPSTYGISSTEDYEYKTQIHSKSQISDLQMFFNKQKIKEDLIPKLEKLNDSTFVLTQTLKLNNGINTVQLKLNNENGSIFTDLININYLKLPWISW